MEKVEVNQKQCISCGACTSVCPTEALYFDKDYKIKYDSSKCTNCGACVKVCPVRAIKKI
ncbi:MAG: 4Fe-4S binding protein [Mycoplasmataceae bacterium]|jgi:ferredoxin|nr:4Fe-4S binding protein [Mycoplasmataceae bacterium]